MAPTTGKPRTRSAAAAPHQPAPPTFRLRRVLIAEFLGQNSEKGDMALAPACYMLTSVTRMIVAEGRRTHVFSSSALQLR